MKTLLTRQNEAAARLISRRKRSTKEQIAFLDTRPGSQKRERARLYAK